MPHPDLHLSQHMAMTLSCGLERRWGSEAASIPWIDRETLHLLTDHWLTSDDNHSLTITLPGVDKAVRLSGQVMEAYDGARNPFGDGVIHVCRYQVPSPEDERALNAFLQTINPTLDLSEISGPMSYSGRADIVDALRGHLRGPARSLFSSVEDSPSIPSHDRLAIAEDLLVKPTFAQAPSPCLFASFKDWSQVRVALRRGPNWIRLVLHPVPEVELMDTLLVVLQLPDGVTVQLEAQAVKIRQGRLLLHANNAPPWALQALGRAEQTPQGP